MSHHRYLSTPWLTHEKNVLCRRLSSSQMEVSSVKRPDRLLGRTVLKEVIHQWAHEKHHLDLNSNEIEITPDDSGKPYFNCQGIDASISLPDISMSHCNDGNEIVAVAAISLQGHLLGIDYEKVLARRTGRWIKRAFSANELKLIDQENLLTTLGLWASKEAASKALGIGLREGPQKWIVTNASPDLSEVRIQHNDQRLNVKIVFGDDDVTAYCLTDKTNIASS